MIMFRHKINGQTAVTAQQAIPRVIISLIMVTFSYAIVGFMIDLMYLSMFLIVGIFESGAFFDSDVINDNILDLVSRLYFGTGDPFLFGTTTNIVEEMVQNLTNNNFAASALGLLGGVTLALVLAVAILINTFRLFFYLLRYYATVVLLTVASPLLLMMGAIPGNNAFGKWIKQVAGNLLPFPAVLLLLVMYYYFTQSAAVASGGGFMPPFLIGGGQSNAIVGVMGLAILLALPEVVKHIQETVAGKGGLGEMIATQGVEGLKRGWTGGELIPGIGGTHTEKLPLVGSWIGSGRNATKTAGVAAATTAGTGWGAFRSVFNKKFMGRPRERGFPSFSTGADWGKRFGKRVDHQSSVFKNDSKSGKSGSGGSH
jgi:hypothetical protein